MDFQFSSYNLVWIIFAFVTCYCLFTCLFLILVGLCDFFRTLGPQDTDSSYESYQLSFDSSLIQRHTPPPKYATKNTLRYTSPPSYSTIKPGKYSTL